jgi:hypothetical protein
MSGSQPDIDALVSGRIAGWRESIGPYGNYFLASGAPTSYGVPDADGTFPIHTVPVCRFFIPPGSHFLSASEEECNATGFGHPEFVLETRAAFHVVLPNTVTGDCPHGVGYAFAPISIDFYPVYRLWNARADTNHRFTMSTLVRDEMLSKGWVSEGYGQMGVVMCVPDYE